MGKKSLRDINVSLLLLIVISLFCSCTGEMNAIDGNNNKQINFSVSVPSWKNNDSIASNSTKSETRATPITDTFLGTDQTFGIIADVVNGNNYTTEIDKEVVSYNTTNKIWETVANHYWPGVNKTVNFYAYYPASITNGTITHTAGTTPILTYTIPTDAATQADIMTSIGTGISGTTYSSTSVSFKHILAAVKFNVGTSGMPSGTIKSVSITGVKTSGTYTFDNGWVLGPSSKDVISSPSIAITGTPGTSITSGTYTFLMIPQIFTNATITLTYNTGTSYKQTISGTWSANNIYTYNLSKPVNVSDYYYSDGTWGTIAEHTNSIAKPIAVIFSNSTSTTDKGHKWTHGYGMSLTNASSSAKWGTYGQDTPLENLNVGNSGWKYASNLKDGYTNTQTIKSTYDLSPTSYPAFFYALNYAIEYPSISSGWFLPSIGQWYDICVNLGKVSTIPSFAKYNSIQWFSSGVSCCNNINIVLVNLENLGYNITKFSAASEKYWTSNEADGSENAFYVKFTNNDELNFNQESADNGVRKNGVWFIRPVIAF